MHDLPIMLYPRPSQHSPHCWFLVLVALIDQLRQIQKPEGSTRLGLGVSEHGWSRRGWLLKISHDGDNSWTPFTSYVTPSPHIASNSIHIWLLWWMISSRIDIAPVSILLYHHDVLQHRHTHPNVYSRGTQVGSFVTHSSNNSVSIRFIRPICFTQWIM